MSKENKNSQLTERGERLKKASIKAGKGLGVLAIAAGAGFGAGQLDDSPEMHGKQVIVVDTGDTVDEIINVHVEGGASHTGAVRTEVLGDPDNADVFENGLLDPGEELEIPEKVTN